MFWMFLVRPLVQRISWIFVVFSKSPDSKWAETENFRTNCKQEGPFLYKNSDQGHSPSAFYAPEYAPVYFSIINFGKKKIKTLQRRRLCQQLHFGVRKKAF